MTISPSDSSQQIARAAGYSRYLARLLAADPALLTVAETELPCTAAAMRGELAAAVMADDAGLGRALRRLRQRVMARMITRDLSGRATLD